GWRQNLRVDRHHGLEQTGDSGRGFGVADVGFDGADDGWGRIGFGLPPGARERFQFRGIPDGSAGAVSLEVGDGINAKAGATVSAAQGLELSARLRPSQAAAAI